MKTITVCGGVRIINDYETDRCGDCKDYVLASEANERIKELEDALSKIAYPIKYLQSNLKKGEQLNGVMALELADDPCWLKEIARAALEVKS
jgi:hypothetical protein